MFKIRFKEGFNFNNWDNFLERIYPIWETFISYENVKKLDFEDSYICSDEIGFFLKDLFLNIYNNYNYKMIDENWNMFEKTRNFPLEFLYIKGKKSPKKMKI